MCVISDGPVLEGPSAHWTTGVADALLPVLMSCIVSGGFIPA
ncbi:hypothetical protein [Allokutzneria oryzae]|uniref:Uncharacterized protein n=1 Tax=Allokutzneria oryzae TaxID=1378989 RepID=A0ABV6A3U3_9PSEU